MADCFELGESINQHQQLCSSISRESCTSSVHERDYSDIERYDEESTDDRTQIAEHKLENQDPDFC